MKFTNITLADGKSVARDGQGLKRTANYYVNNSGYSIGVSGDSDDLYDDYYVVWNKWPIFTGVEGLSSSASTTSTALGTVLGINLINTKANVGAITGGTSLDIAIIRKLDRKAVRVTITGTTAAHYKAINPSNASTTITAIDSKDGPWTPELGRLLNQGQI